MKNSNFSTLKTIVITTLLWNVYGCGNPKVCMSGIGDDFIIDETLAISLSRNTLIDIGVDVLNMVPVPYDRYYSENLFANNGDPNSGYVLWHKMGESTLFEYSVSIEKQGDKIYCDAQKTK